METEGNKPNNGYLDRTGLRGGGGLLEPVCHLVKAKVRLSKHMHQHRRSPLRTGVYHSVDRVLGWLA